jgi:intracellular multiplication protein IcmO
MLAMGRGLNICFMLGFQEVSGIWARLGEKTASVLGNANLTIAMRQQDSGRTREWIEKTAGQTYITQATSYHGAGDGAYREARHAEVRPVSRVDWNDLTTLIEGEAIVLFGGRRIYARVFHAQIDDAGPKRLGRSMMLRAPDPDEVRSRLARLGRIAAAIENGKLAVGPEEELSPGLGALLRGFREAAQQGGDARGCARGALDEIGRLPEDLLSSHPPEAADGSLVTSVTPMLSAATTAVVPSPENTGLPSEPIEVRLVRRLSAIEQAAGASSSAARSAALSILAERDAALEAPIQIEPPAMTLERFQAHLAAVTRQLEMLRDTASVRRAA